MELWTKNDSGFKGQERIFFTKIFMEIGVSTVTKTENMVIKKRWDFKKLVWTEGKGLRSTGPGYVSEKEIYLGERFTSEGLDNKVIRIMRIEIQVEDGREL